jgi:hypothetical protein
LPWIRIRIEIADLDPDPGAWKSIKINKIDLISCLKGFCTVVGRVVDPYSFFPDPDPEFDVRDQYGSGYRSGSNTDPGL